MITTSIRMTYLTAALFLAATCTHAAPPRHDPSPEAGLIKLEQPQPKDVDLYANWYHNKTHGFRVLIPVGAKLAFSWKSATTIQPLLRITLHQEQNVDLAYVPPQPNQKESQRDSILKSFAGTTITRIDEGTSLVDTSWKIGIKFMEVEEKTFAQQYCVTDTSDGGALIFLFTYGQSFEAMKATMIVDTLEFVSKNFLLKDVLEQVSDVKQEDDKFPQRFVFAYRENGLVSGLTREVDGRGRTVRAETALRGQAHGLDMTLYSTGAIYMVRCYVAGKCEGVLFKYFRDGNLYCVTDIVHDNADGLDITFFRGGKIASKTQCHDGHFHGIREHFLPEGQVYAVTTFQFDKEIETRELLELNDKQADQLDAAMQDIYEIIDGVWPTRDRVTLRK